MGCNVGGKEVDVLKMDGERVGIERVSSCGDGDVVTGRHDATGQSLRAHKGNALPDRIPIESGMATLLHSRNNSVLVLLGQ